jgi:MFS family permease
MEDLSVSPQLRVPARHIFAVAAGNALAFYDFLAFAYFAVQIGRTFFPNPATSLMMSLATFGAGFLTRPIGGLVIGRMGDRVGRKPAMMFSFTLMGVAIIGLALTPSYASIGIAAPILVLIFRLMLGFGAGGEVGPSTAYLLEVSPPGRRGFYTSLQYATQDFAGCFAGLVGFILASALSERALDEWGWRVAFLIGAAIVPVGVVIRRSLPESIDLPSNASAVAVTNFRPYRRVAILGFVLLSSTAVIAYVQTDLTAYALGNLHLSTQFAFAATLVNGFFTFSFDPVGGWLSDKVGRKPVVMIGTIATLLVSFPAFYAIIHLRSGLALLVTAAVLGALTGILGPPILTALTEALPKNIRSSAVSIIYALTIALFGGTTPFMITWIIAATGNPFAPAWFLVIASAVTLVAARMLKETAPNVVLRDAKLNRA